MPPAVETRTPGARVDAPETSRKLGSADSLARYRQLMKAAPRETLERATTEMLAALSADAAREARRRLDQKRRFDDAPELVHAFVNTAAARTFVRPAGAVDDADADADFSGEFGHVYGYAGGSGFEGTDFDRWV